MFWTFWSALYDLSCVNMPSPWDLHCDCQKKADVSLFCSTETPCQCRRHKRCRFDPWVGKIPWRRKWQRIPVFLLGESHRQEPDGVAKRQTQLSTHIIAFIYTYILNFSSGTYYCAELLPACGHMIHTWPKRLDQRWTYDLSCVNIT